MKRGTSRNNPSSGLFCAHQKEKIMKTFKSISDVDRFRKHPLHATIKSLVSTIIADYPEYRPQNDGYVVLLEPGDVDRVLDDLDMP
jgi:hypothetical protein